MKEYIVSMDTAYEFEMRRFEELQELIRCKDCKWYEIAHLKKDGTDDRRFKPTWCTLWRAQMSEDDFCSKAERKEE